MVQSRNNLKSKFETGDIPTQTDFHDLIDSLYHKTDDTIRGVVLPYFAGRNYQPGECALYDFGNGSGYQIYRCLTATSGAFNPAHWALLAPNYDVRQTYTTATNAFTSGDIGKLIGLNRSTGEAELYSWEAFPPNYGATDFLTLQRWDAGDTIVIYNELGVAQYTYTADVEIPADTDLTAAATAIAAYISANNLDFTSTSSGATLKITTILQTSSFNGWYMQNEGVALTSATVYVYGGITTFDCPLMHFLGVLSEIVSPTEIKTANAPIMATTTTHDVTGVNGGILVNNLLYDCFVVPANGGSGVTPVKDTGFANLQINYPELNLIPVVIGYALKSALANDPVLIKQTSTLYTI